MTTRLNARVPEEVARKVRYLQARLGRSTTDVVIASLEAYYVQVTREEAPSRLLADLVGCAEGPGDLSSTYKAQFGDLIAAKYGVEEAVRPRWEARSKAKRTRRTSKRNP